MPEEEDDTLQSIDLDMNNENESTYNSDTKFPKDPLRWGKRAGPESTLLRWGKRASPGYWFLRSMGKRVGPDSTSLRWGKRPDPESTLLRWGKRAGPDSTSLRWGKRPKPESTLLRWGKRAGPDSTSLRWGKRPDPESTLLRWGKRQAFVEPSEDDILHLQFNIDLDLNDVNDLPNSWGTTIQKRYFLEFHLK